VGQLDVAIGAAGLVMVDDWRGRSDAHGRELRATVAAVGDAVAAMADIARSKDASEPVVLVRGLARFVTPEDGAGAAVLRRPKPDDLFR
jgi:coenzyme F420-0:L-glutamate ligase/coenzyme F420-1:gamma-L-glutamate ligase